MSDRGAFRGLVAVAAFLLFCLGCLLALPLRVIWLTHSLWLMCCSWLTSQMAMPMPTDSWPMGVAASLAGLLFNLMLGYALWTAWRLWRATQRLLQTTQTAQIPPPPLVARLAAQLNLADSLIVVSDRVPFSFCYGLWRPRICLSLGLVELLTETELEAVLQHEAYHLHRREPLRLAMAICLSRFFFFVPMLAELRDRYLAEKELSADAMAVALTSRAALAGALYKLITLKKPFVLPSLATVAGLSITAQRVDRLITPSMRPAWLPSRWSILSTLVIFMLGCLFMLVGLG
jgi:Zn-dependent protease with chaperone function